MLRFAGGALGTRVGRRTLLLFIGCALLPTSVLAVFAYSEVRSTLRGEAFRSLEEAAKRRSAQYVERGTWLAHLLGDEAQLTDRLTREDEGNAGQRFRTVVLVNDDGRTEILTPGNGPPPSVSLDQTARAFVDEGGVTIVIEPASTPRVWFVARLNAASRPALIWAEPEPRFLWGFAADEAMTPELCVVEVRQRVVLQCSAGALPGAALATLGGSVPSDWIAASRSLFLRHEFAADDWSVVSMQSVSDALRPVHGFGRTFALVTGLSLLVVFFTSHVQIRRQTEPLKRLHAATKDVAAGKFDVVVRADSNDEFGALAASFMSMSSTLGRQFEVLHALDEVDRSALEASSSASLMSSAAHTLLTAASTDRLVLTVPPAEGGNGSWQQLDLVRGSQGTTPLRPIDQPLVVRLRPTDLGHDGEDVSDAIGSLGLPDAASCRWILFPLWHHDENQGAVAVGVHPDRTLGVTERHELRRLTDRLAIALANTRLVHRLDALSLGTLTAFARAIDANSHWTAGHSERVTQVALLIADALGITGMQRDVLHRGSLLHDIGKIGVPASVLDKAGPLTPQEREIIQTHPGLGASILQPIRAFHDIIPIVRSHHERVDGKGYPDGLRGGEIPYLARILSVADVYDALVSKRPYRAGMATDIALQIIRTDAGRAFDAHIAAVFLTLHEQGAVTRLMTADSQASALAAAVGHGRQLLEELV